MVTILGGLIGGLLATIVMTAFMMALGDDSPPPTSVLWSKYVGNGPPEEYLAPGMALHVLYGTIAGAAFVVVASLLGYGLESLTTSLVAGIVYGLALALVGMVFWMKIVIGLDADAKTAGMFGFFHLVYGVVLGGFVGAGFLA
jgi:hypothetical protein